MTPTNALTQLRLIVETEDFDAAVAFYRDALGLPVELSLDGDSGERVVILTIPAATLEISNPAQVRMIDAVEVGRATSRAYPHSIRVAFEVPDVVTATEALVAGGAELLAPPTETPWRSLNARLEAPGGMQITAYQELGAPAEPAASETGGTTER